MRPGLSPGTARWIALAAALAAALLSAAYVPAYLRGGPRIIDATSYWLEARALAQGHLAWPVEEPAASTLGRFLVRGDGAHGPQAAVLFPPGYPAALALGFLAGAPLLIGPLLAAALVLATWELAARLFPPPEGDFPLIPALAAVLSAACAALRYHTADTMSHGLAALCFAASLALALRALAAPSPWRAARAALLAGLFAGWLAATRPPSALALGAALLALLAWPSLGASPAARAAPLAAAPPPRRLRVALALALGALPGLALLLAHQRAATGAWDSSQALYYATSDGPPGCFRYGFGAGIGCLGEHGDFVRHNLPDGYGALAALKTTLRRLKLHLLDPLNAEPLFALVIAGAAPAFRRAPASRPAPARILVIAVLLQIAAYAPFYFDGNYPAGGARLLADILPLEHVLAAAALAALAARVPPIARAPAAPSRLLALAAAPSRLLVLAAALPLAGFALRAASHHAQLRDREGGAPMFDPAALARAGVTRGLVFVDTDHGFNLGHDPDPAAPLQVLRHRGDALDAMAWDARGRPPAYRYRFTWPEEGAPAEVRVEPLLLSPPGDELRIEAESLWPPRAQAGAWALPEHAAGTCASAGRWLAVRAAPDAADPVVRVELPARWLRGAALSPRVAAAAGEPSGAIRLLIDGAAVHEWPPLPPAEGPGPRCVLLDPHPVPEGARRVELALVARPLLLVDAVLAGRAKPVDH